MKRSRPLATQASVCLGILLMGCVGAVGGSGDGSSNSGSGGSAPGGGSGGSTTQPAGACDTVAPTRIWRLNDRQLSAAVHDLVPSVPAPLLATPGRDPNEFVSWEEQFPVQQAFATLLSDAAYAIAGQAAASRTNR